MTSNFLDLVGEIVTVLGIIGSCSGFISWAYERRIKRRLEKESCRRVWSDISKIRGLMSDLEKDSHPEFVDAGKLRAIGKLSNMLRDLIREACLQEGDLDIKKIKAWRKLGKLGSDWQEHLAFGVLLSDEIDYTELESMSDMFGSWDEISVEHLASAKRHAPQQQK
jgi:hypothetical protein